MPVFQLTRELIFPPVSLSEKDGLLAVGGDLSPERLELAYRSGIFPWYSGDEILWWSPDPRFVLKPEALRVSKSMKQLLRSNKFVFTVDQAFSEVIKNCKTSERAGQDGTWITEEMQQAYITLHNQGLAHSAETWENGKLVGGLYGIRIGSMFFGESMFSKISNASKFAFIKYVQTLQQSGLQLIDCQVHTDHLESLGAEMIPRAAFLRQLKMLPG
jgi:leucyl/phenylalanyl-tRNA--protein transferase